MMETFYPNEGVCPNCNQLTWLETNGVLPFSHRHCHCGQFQDLEHQSGGDLFSIKDIKIEPDKKTPQQFVIAVSVVGDFWGAKEHLEEVMHNLLLMLTDPHANTPSTLSV